jgi:hypothetical protein
MIPWLFDGERPCEIVFSLANVQDQGPSRTAGVRGA